MAANIAYAAPDQRFFAVVTPVADIRSGPEESKARYGHDDAQETQVLYNEILLYRGEKEDWYQVEAVEQREFSHHQSWQGYPGWIRKENVLLVDEVPKYNSIVGSVRAQVFSAPSSSSPALLTVSGGTKFEEAGFSGGFWKVSLPGKTFGWIRKNEIVRLGGKMNEKKIRKNIIRTARLFLKTPYLWGGRSFHTPFFKDVATGVDCSGLVNLAYRISGVDVPRDAHEQWMVAEPIPADQLKPGDLIFISRPVYLSSISHVMLSLGGENFIEAPGTGKTVRLSNFKEKFGLDLKDLEGHYFIASGKKVYFGRVLP